MELPILFDANCFFISKRYNIQKLLDEFSNSQSYSFHITPDVENELISINVNKDLFNILEVSIDSINNIKEKSSMKYPPQDNDLSLIAAAFSFVEKKNVKKVIVVSNDYKLYIFTNQITKNILVTPVSTFCFMISTSSLNSLSWRNFGKESIQNYLSYNITRSKHYDITEVNKWILNSMADLISNEGQIPNLSLEPSKSDIKEVHKYLKNQKFDKDKYPYLISLIKYLSEIKIATLTSADSFAKPHNLENTQLKENQKEISNRISLWFEVLINSQNLSEFYVKILETIIFKELLDLYYYLLEYSLAQKEEIDIKPILIQLKHYASKLKNYDKLFEINFLAILNRIRMQDLEFASMIAKNSMISIPETMKSEYIQLTFLNYIISNKLSNVDETEYYQLELTNAFLEDKSIFEQAISNLGDQLFLWDMYEEAKKIYVTVLENNIIPETKKTITWYRKAILCDMILGSKSIQVMNLLEKIIEKVSNNPTLYNFFKNEKSPKPSKQGIWTRKYYENQIPSFLKLPLRIVSINKQTLTAIIDSRQGLFEIDIFLEMISFNVMLHSYDYEIVLKSDIEIEIIKCSNDNVWLNGRIIIDKNIPYIIRKSL